MTGGILLNLGLVCVHLWPELVFSENVRHE